MSRRIDIELTSALADNSWTWRAAGAKQPKGTLDGSILSPGAGVGDIIKVEVEQEIDGINVLSVVGGRDKHERADRIELLPSEREFKPLIETRAKRDRDERGGRGDRDRRPRRDRDDKPGRGDKRGRDDKRGRTDRTGGGREERAGRDERAGRSRRGGPSFTPPPEIPQRPKPKRLKPGKRNRTAVLAELPEEQRPIAELALQGMGAVRQRLREENDKAAKEGRSPMPEASVLKLAEDLIPKLRVAEWRDRAEAALRQVEHLDLRDLRSVVAAAGDPAVARDETTSALAAELSSALTTKQEQELRLWFGDVDAALAVGRVIRALRLSSQPPKAGVPFPTDIAQRLLDSTNASLAPMDTPERWIAMLEAAAFSPVRTGVAPVRKPDVVNDELLATVKRLAPALPQVAALFEIEVDPKAPMPKPLRPGPRGKKVGRDAEGGKRSDRPRQGDTQRGAGRRPAPDQNEQRPSTERAPDQPAGSPTSEPVAPVPSDPTNDAPSTTEPAAPTEAPETTTGPTAEAESAIAEVSHSATAAPSTAEPAAPPEAPETTTGSTADGEMTPADDVAAGGPADTTPVEPDTAEPTSPPEAPDTATGPTADDEPTPADDVAADEPVDTTKAEPGMAEPTDPTTAEPGATEPGATEPGPESDGSDRGVRPGADGGTIADEPDEG